MNTRARFLSVVEAYPGYCQNCHEPQLVGRITVTGWPYSGLACSRCLGQLADEVQRRASSPPFEVSLAVALTGGSNGNGHAR